MNAESLEKINVFSNSERFTDVDVRNHKLLRVMATEYARTYRGDFPFLRQIREHVYGHVELPVAVVRGVLNCMLGDYSVDWSQVVSEMKEQPAPVLQLVPKPKPLPREFRIRATYKFDLVYSTQRGANRVHRVDHGQSTAWYHREAHTINFVLKSMCFMRWQSWRYYGDHKLKIQAVPLPTPEEICCGYDEFTMMPVGYRVCPDCERNTP